MKGNAGYSLLEVLIAFAIMSLVLSAVIPGQAKVLSRASDKDDAVLAYDYALSKIAAVGYDVPLEVGAVQSEYRDWLVEMTQEPIEGPELAIELLRIEVVVKNRSGRQIAIADALRAMQ